MTHKVGIIGAGPAGLMAAHTLAQAGVAVIVYDAMPSAGRKFLMAGKSGLNITHAEPLVQFLARYPDADARLINSVTAFNNNAIIDWMDELGIAAHTGTTGRIFPASMKASPLLRSWLAKLAGFGVTLKTRHRWTGWGHDNQLTFDTPEGEHTVAHDAVILCLGGASWRRLGSDGIWSETFTAAGLAVTPFAPSNIGVVTPWSDHLLSKFEGAPVKNISLSLETESETITTRSEFVITRTGMESGGIYSLSAPLRKILAREKVAILKLDLYPDQSQSALAKKLSRPRGKNSLASHLRKCLNLTGVKAALLHELAPKTAFQSAANLAAAIKSLTIQITGFAPIDQAISTAGGASWNALDDHFMLVSKPGTFCAGEMIDWDAPTGGYLITACLATGKQAAHGALRWLETIAKCVQVES